MNLSLNISIRELRILAIGMFATVTASLLVWSFTRDPDVTDPLVRNG